MRIYYNRRKYQGTTEFKSISLADDINNGAQDISKDQDISNKRKVEEAKLDTKLSRRSEYYNLDNTGIISEVNEDSQSVNTETSVSFEKNYNYKIVNIVTDNQQETSFHRAMKKIRQSNIYTLLH